MCDLCLALKLVNTATEVVRCKRDHERHLHCVAVQNLFIKSVEETEADLEKALVPFFRDQGMHIARNVGAIDGNQKTAEDENAAALVQLVFDPKAWNEKLVDLVLPILLVRMAQEARELLTELGIGFVGKGHRTEGTKATTATEWLAAHSDTPEDLEELLESFGELVPGRGLPINLITELPEGVRREILSQLRQTFQQPYWDNISVTTAGDAERVLKQGLTEGWSIRRMADEMAASLGGDKYALMRGTLIARTECLPGETIVDGARVVAAYKRWYSGPFIEIVTKAGRKFSGTPNHPVLTLRGWVGLGDLQESDNLICYQRNVNSSGASGNIDVDNPPPTISDIFDSLSAVGIVERRHTTDVDFHGDGMDGEVDIFTPDGELSYGHFVPVEESGIDHVLSEADLRKILLVAKCNPFPRGVGQLGGLCVTTDSVSGLDDGSSDTGRTNAKGIGDGDCGFPGKISSNNFVGPIGQVLSKGPVPAGKHQFASTFAVSSFNSKASASPQYSSFVASENSGYFNAAKAGHIEIDHPLAIRRIESWSGHVFNLTTRDGYFSIADGMYTGNSANALNGARKGTMDALKADMPPEAADVLIPTWLSALADTTRPEHADLDQVPSDADGLWNLAGFLVPYPGHFSLPAEQRCNCLCTTVLEFGVQSEEARQLLDDYAARQEQTRLE